MVDSVSGWLEGRRAGGLECWWAGGVSQVVALKMMGVRVFLARPSMPNDGPGVIPTFHGRMCTVDPRPQLSSGRGEDTVDTGSNRPRFDGQ